MKARLIDEFSRWITEYRDDPLREDAYVRAARVLQLLETVSAPGDEAAIPPDSILREFIGGSCYTY